LYVRSLFLFNRIVVFFDLPAAGENERFLAGDLIAG